VKAVFIDIEVIAVTIVFLKGREVNNKTGHGLED
jgi:hypothetical protein